MVPKAYPASTESNVAPITVPIVTITLFHMKVENCAVSQASPKLPSSIESGTPKVVLLSPSGRTDVSKTSTTGTSV